ncbi:MAG: hypothetical protein JRH06_13475 [Deltaproteobacteria bacterium]|nr:hypothetical protein [Deltaproteobacteria bacterium]MBW2138552.1 hypothetical protein [Deltaproteobacteria bacterium]
MKRYSVLAGLGMLAALFLCGSSHARTGAPHGVGGFVLGKNIEDYRDRVRMDTSLPIRYTEYIREVQVRPLRGFKSGIIAYGTCVQPGRIVRIKLKYADSSKDFYKKLLKILKERFGEPSEWRGDPFHVVIAWKWSFVDEEKNRISLTLQHNTKDEEEKIGNSVKITMTNLLEDELRCYREKHPEYKSPADEQQGQMKWQKEDMEQFIPR